MLRYVLVVVLVATQLALGSAGRVVCLGGGACHVPGAAEPGGCEAAACSHDEGAPGVPLPAPAHSDDRDCACVDLITPVARPSGQAAGDLPLELCGAFLLLELVYGSMPDPLVPAFVPELERPPDPAPGLSTTRLLI